MKACRKFGARVGASTGVGAATVLATLVAGAGPASADVTSLGGGAFGAQALVTPAVGAPVSVGPLPALVLPPAGTTQQTATRLATGIAGVFSTGVLTVTTQGDTTVSHLRTARSTARVDNLSILSTLGASTVRSSCASNGTGSTGVSQFVGLTGVAGVSDVPLPNTVRNIPGVGTVTFNEQIVSNVPGSGTTITVNAIHVRLAAPTVTGGDIIIAQSRCAAFGPDVLRGAALPGDPPVDGLPVTGGAATGSALAGGALVIVGLGTLFLARRRRPSPVTG